MHNYYYYHFGYLNNKYNKANIITICRFRLAILNIKNYNELIAVVKKIKNKMFIIYYFKDVFDDFYNHLMIVFWAFKSKPY